MRNARKLAAAAVVVGVSALASAAPATAQTSVDGVTATGQFAGVLQPNGRLLVEKTCTASATGAVASVNISRCQIVRNNATALPGNAAVVASTEDLPLAPFSLCWTATATFVNGSTRTTTGCRSTGSNVTGTLAGAGASRA